jgi:dienelactone hydrolase
MVGLDYFTPAPSSATDRSKAIVLLTDIFGLPLPNPRIVADHLAENVGVDVWVPDFFNGASHRLMQPPAGDTEAYSLDLQESLLST